MGDVKLLEILKDIGMKIAPVKLKTDNSLKIQPNKNQTPIKDALIVSAYCSIPIAFYEITSRLAKGLKKKDYDYFEYQ